MKTALSEFVHQVHPAGKTDNSNLGLWIGLGYFLLACLAWIPLDLWLHRHHHPYITTCIRKLLESGSWYAILAVCFLGMVFALFLYHFFYERSIV